MDRSRAVLRRRIAWSLVGVVATAGVAFLVYTFVGAIVLGLFLYYATRPVYRWLDERIDHPDLNASLTLLAVGLPIALVLLYGVQVGVTELSQFLQRHRLAALRSVLQPYLDLSRLRDVSRLVTLLQNNASTLTGLVWNAFLWAVRVFVAVTVAFYLLRDDRKIAAWVGRTFDERSGLVSFLEGVDDDLTTVYTGNLLTIAVTGGIAVATYYAFNVVAPPSGDVAHPLLLGLLIGVFTLVPAVGMKLIYVPYAAYLLVRSVSGASPPLWVPVAFFLITLVVVDSIPDFFIRTYLSKGDINMGLMLLSYVLGSIAFGWYGLFLGPVLLVVFLHFARRVFPRLVDRDARRFVAD